MAVYVKLAEQIIEAVGGVGNINTVVHCATRLRFKLYTPPQGAAEKIKSLEQVIAVVESGGQFQVVIGQQVGDVFRCIEEYLRAEPVLQAPLATEKHRLRVICWHDLLIWSRAFLLRY